MFLELIRNKGEAFIGLFIIAVVLICIPINIYFQPILANKLNIPTTREEKIEKTCIGMTGIICFDINDSKVETVSNIPIIYIVMFIIEIAFAFCLSSSIWILVNQISDNRTIKYKNKSS